MKHSSSVRAAVKGRDARGRFVVKRPEPAQKIKSPVAVPDSVNLGAARTDLVPKTQDWQNVLKPAVPPPGVLPKNKKLAMDAIGWGNDMTAWVAGAAYNWAFVEGYTFMGYPYLSQLSNIAEYRLLASTLAEEATRKWIEIKSKSGQAKVKKTKIDDLEKRMKQLGVRQAFKTMSEQDSFFGRSHLYIDTGVTDDPKELKKPLGEADKLTQAKFKGKKGFIRALKSVEPVWCYPSRYDAADPLKDAWYRPDVWFVNGKEVHSTRLLTFVGRPVADLLKPAFSFGGLSLSQMAKPYIDNWLQTRQSVNDLIQAFSVMVLKTDLQGLMQDGGAELDKRIQLFNNYRNNKGVMAISKNDEDFANVSATIAGLDKLQAQAQEHICSVGQIPLVKYTGISPAGLNASSDGEIRVFYDREHAYQEYFFDPHLSTVFKLVQLDLWGEIDEDLYYVFRPLVELDDRAKAEVKKIQADTSKTLVDGSIISQEEARKPLADDPDQSYGDLDPEDVPEVEMPEEGNVKERVDESEVA